jgi:hypothetical protein
MTLEQARQPDGMIVPCQTCIAIPCVCGAEGVHVASQPAPPPKDVAVTEGDDEEGESVIQRGVREINERHAALYERATRAEAAIAAVRELHAPDLVGDATRMALGLPTNRVCSVCENREGNVIPYPCETIRAIDAVAAPERTEPTMLQPPDDERARIRKAILDADRDGVVDAVAAYVAERVASERRRYTSLLEAIVTNEPETMAGDCVTSYMVWCKEAEAFLSEGA